MKMHWPIFEPDSKRGLQSYAVAVILVLLVMWTRLAFGHSLVGPTLIVFTLPIILAASWGGVGPGLLATATAILAANYYLLPPIGSFAVNSPSEILQQLILGTIGVFISTICETLHRARRRAEEARMRAEGSELRSARLAAIVESSKDAVIGKDVSGIIISWNAAATDIFGYGATEAIGRPISILIPPERLAEQEDTISQLRAGLRMDHFETVRLRKNGSDVFVSLSVSPILDASGKIVGTSTIARDTTEKERANGRLQALQSELAQVQRLNAMGQMGAAIAHELNQPLTATASYIGAAKRMLKSDVFATDVRTDILEAMEKASVQTLRAGSIIRNLREFVDRRDTEKTLSDLNAVVEDAIALGLIGAGHANIDLNRDLSLSLPQILINRIHIQQVLVNLIRNSIEAMAKSVKRTLTLTTACEGNFAVIVLRDTGPGLPAEVRAKLFQPFVTTKEKGMGIGLSICQSIVESHGGKIQVPDDSKAGAEFRIFLPLDIHEAPRAGANASVGSDGT